MDKFDLEQARIILVSVFSPVLGILTPTKGFIFALIIMFGLNIFSGMKADGVTFFTCKNFSGSKFKNALFEFLLYLFIIEVVYTVMVQCGDGSAAIIAAKSITYVFVYFYSQNSLKNLIRVYPKNVPLRVLYHIIRLEFTRAMPKHIRDIVERVECEEQEKVNPKK